MKIGILGTGRLLDKVAPTLQALECTELYAIASKSPERAQSRKAEYGFKKAYGSYEELLCDPEVELVYVITPHSRHYEDIMAAMKHGKPVLCEKPFTVNARQARAVRAYSKENRIFAAEAIWTRYMPSVKMIKEAMESGIIGEIMALSANLHYPITYKKRIVDPALAGGALLDVGVYGINFASMFFGDDIERVESSVQMMESGVDAQENITLFYRDGKMAAISAGVLSRSDRKGIIYGSKGYIVVENINDPQSVAVYDEDDRLLIFSSVPDQISGYEYEYMEAVESVKKRMTGCPSMPLDETIRMLEIMDELRASWGLVYPCE